jgi:hypothetical protein
MNPRDFIVVAEMLINGSDLSPAVCRTVIGRSYYAALNVLYSLLKELGIPLEKGKESHKEIMDLVAESKDANLKYACDILAQQKHVRVHADYHMDNLTVETPLKASQALRSAKITIQRVDDVRSNADQWREASHHMIYHAKNVLRKNLLHSP